MRFTLFIIIIITLFSCKSYKNIKKGESSISFHSIYENDNLNVNINDSIVFKNHKINMIIELGISSNSTIILKDKKFKISGTYSAIVNKELDIERTLKFDTILITKNGRLIDIRASYDKIFIEQTNKTRIVE